VMFNKGKHQVLPLGRNSPMHQYVVGLSSAEKDLGCWWTPG